MSAAVRYACDLKGISPLINNKFEILFNIFRAEGVHLCKVRKKYFIHHKTIQMEAIKDLLNSVKSLNVSTENEDFIAIQTSNAKSNREVVMSRNEAINNLEQSYYNKASGCSVKAQKDNLFDYYSSFVND